MVRALLLALTFATLLPAGQAPPTGSITGRVVDLDGEPIAGATAFVWQRTADGATRIDARTDAQGRFRIDAIDPHAQNELYVDADGFGRLFVGEVPTYCRATNDVGDLILEPGARVTGRIVDADGAPIAAAKITIETWRHLTSGCVAEAGPRRTCIASDDGTFETPALGTADHNLRVAAPGRVTVEQDLTVGPGDADRTLDPIRLARDVPIAGHVVTPNGQPIAGATLYADLDYDQGVTSDASGAFVIHGHGADAHDLHVEASGFVERQIELPADHGDVRVELDVAHRILGRAVDAATGKPVNILEARLCTVERHPDGSYDLYG